MLTMPDKLKHYAKTYVVKPSKKRVVVSVTPLSFSKKRIFLKIYVVKIAVNVANKIEPSMR